MVLIILTFALGIGNFAAHKAVLESGHPMLDMMPAALRANGGRISLAIEFAVLLSAMLLAANGWPAAAWVYLIYSMVGMTSAWLMLTDRV